VNDYSREEAAGKAGVDADYVDRLVELGFLSPGASDTFSSGDVLRARWIRSLEVAGVLLDGMAAAVRDGTLSFSFLSLSAFDRFTGITSTTFQELSEETGIPLQLLTVVREAFGYPEPTPQDHVREDELSVARAVELEISRGYRPVVIERWLRVYADSFRRIAETETDGWRSEVIVPLLETGMSEGEMLDAQAQLGSEISPLMEQALLAIYHGQQEHAWRKSHVEYVESMLEKAGLHSRLQSPPAVSFLDLTGYTSLTEEQGDELAAELAARLRALVRQASLEHEGESVKFLGDGVMFYFPIPTRSALAALDMVEQAAIQALPPARVGIHAGPVVFQEGDYFGRTVNIAARIADYARAGEVLVSQEVVESASQNGVTFNDIGPVALKGVAGPIHVFAAHRDSVTTA
jgi:adenylate cyclase